MKSSLVSSACTAALIRFGSESLRIAFRFAARKTLAANTRLDPFPFSAALLTRLLFLSRVDTFPAPIIPYPDHRKNSKAPLNRVHLSTSVVPPRPCPFTVCRSASRFTVVSRDVAPASRSLLLGRPIPGRISFSPPGERFQPTHSTPRRASKRAATQSFRTRRLFSVTPSPPFRPLSRPGSGPSSLLVSPALPFSCRRENGDGERTRGRNRPSAGWPALARQCYFVDLHRDRAARVKRFRLVILRRFSLAGKTVALRPGTQTISRSVHFRPFLRSRVICETRVGFPVCRGG